MPPFSREQYHAASNQLFEEAKVELADVPIVASAERSDGDRYVMISPGNWSTPDELDGICDYGTIIVRDPGNPQHRYLNFGLGWDKETGAPLHFVIRWRPDVAIVVVETLDFWDFGELLDAVKEEFETAR